MFHKISDIRVVAIRNVEIGWWNYFNGDHDFDMTRNTEEEDIPGLRGYLNETGNAKWAHGARELTSYVAVC